MNWISEDRAIEIGTVSLGKYTFPKTVAFVIKVLEVLFKQVEKYVQATVPVI